jgi:hypothetical protein
VTARVAPIIEPDKVRVITASNEAVVYRALSVQKFMHGELKKFPCFEYSGQSVDSTTLLDHFRRVWNKTGQFLNGDYSAATDNLHPDLGEAVVRALCATVRGPDGLFLTGTPVEELMLCDLLKHEIFYPGPQFNGSKAGTSVGGQFQVWGQLMGLPTSFYVLCLVNAAASSVGLGLTVDETLNGPIAVNGDDIVAWIDEPAQYEGWVEATRAAGLELSPGKNYLTKDFAMINSSVFIPLQRDGEDAGCYPAGQLLGFKEIMPMNQALLFGIEKKGTDAGKDLKVDMVPQEMGPRLRELLLGAQNERQWNIWRSEFLYQHRGVIKKLPPGVSKYLSEQLGGAGIPWDGKESIPEGNLKYGAFVACLDDKKRSNLAHCKVSGMGKLDTWLAQAEDHYSQYVPRVLNERDPWDVVIEAWGFPIERVKSSLGSYLRLCYVLYKFTTEKPDLKSLGSKPVRELTRWQSAVRRGVNRSLGATNTPMTPEAHCRWRPPTEWVVEYDRLNLPRNPHFLGLEERESAYDALGLGIYDRPYCPPTTLKSDSLPRETSDSSGTDWDEDLDRVMGWLLLR